MILRKANITEVRAIWLILQQAIEQRRKDGSEQWQNGYPNEQAVLDDIAQGYGYVLTEDETIIAYAAVIFGIEPAYEVIQGKWLTSGDYCVVHRVATADSVKGRGIATEMFKKIEELCIGNGVNSLRVDTNFDNIPMLKIVDRLGYVYCGEVFFNGSARRAYEKVLF